MSDLVIVKNGILSKHEPIIFEMKNKPLLAKYVESYKIYAYPEELRTSNTYSFVLWALNMLAVNNKDDGSEMHHVALIEFINDSLDTYTYEELKKAIKMYVSGELGLDVYQTLNSVIMGKIMRKYQEIRNEHLRAYYALRKEHSREKLPQLTESAKRDRAIRGVLNYADEFIRNHNGPLKVGVTWIYDFLDELNLIEISNEEKRAIYNVALKQLVSENEGNPKREARELLKSLEEKNATAAVIRAKVLTLNLTILNLKGNRSYEKAIAHIKSKIKSKL